MNLDEMRRLIAYNPETGDFRWKFQPGETKSWNGRNAGQPAGTIYARDGIPRMAVRRGTKSVTALRLAWAFCHGEWPAVNDRILPKNGNLLDARAENLLKMTVQELRRSERRGTKSRFGCGVYRRERSSRFYAFIMIAGERNYLGSFATAEEASQAYEAALKKSEKN